jgi:RNA polymerase sigma-70 factor (ECF subfamily)
MTDAELPERLPAVLAVVHLIATEARAPTGGEDVARAGLEAEAIRLARLLAGLMPGEPEVPSLLALLLFTAARRPARTGRTVSRFCCPTRTGPGGTGARLRKLRRC